jgi:signal transduction histidine kinase
VRATLQAAGEGPAREPAPSPSQQAMRALNRIGDSDLREVVDLVQSICGVESAAISILEEDVYHVLITAGVDPYTCDADESLCSHTMDRHDVVVVQDARGDERFAGSPYVDGRLRDIRFYASAPIYGPDHTMVGRLCLFDSKPRSLSPLQERTLTTLAASITKVIELRLLQNEPETEPCATMDDAVRVAAQISHDMRVPLSALTTSLEMLNESTPSDAAAEDDVQPRLLATARRAADRISHMVDGLLQLNDAGRDLVWGDVDLTSLVRQVASDLGAQLREAEAQLRVDELPVVRADADQLYSVVLNLLGNALKFARPGVAPVIRVDSRRADGAWRIRVVDNGCGIPANRRSEVFSMFSRLNTAVEGHGIGLATVRRIVEMHGGRVGAGEGDGGGAEVWFELPDPVS